DHGEVVGRKTVGTENHQVVQLAVGDLDAALDLVLERHAALARRLEADHAVGVVAVRFVAVAVIAVVAGLFAAFPGGLAHGVDVFLAFVGVVGLAFGQQLFGDLAVTIRAFGLVERPQVVREAQPGHAVDDRPDGGVGGALAVGILDAQDELAAPAPRLQPGVQRGARAANV